MLLTEKKREKFVFPELSRALVVNSFNELEMMDGSQDNLITDAITQHLSTIVGEPGAEDSLAGLALPHKSEEEAMVDLEQIKLEHYNMGMNEAKEQYEAVISDLKSDNNLSSLLKEKIESIAPALNIDEEIIKLSAEMVANIAKRIYLVLPVNFELMLKETMIDRLKKMYKEGDITLSVNPARLGFCKEVLRLEDLPQKIRDKISVIADESLGKDDCSLELGATRFEYNQEQLSFEINQILDQLRQ